MATKRKTYPSKYKLDAIKLIKDTGDIEQIALTEQEARIRDLE